MRTQLIRKVKIKNYFGTQLLENQTKKYLGEPNKIIKVPRDEKTNRRLGLFLLHLPLIKPLPPYIKRTRLHFSNHRS